ncbi:MAG TPA: hypothetical protein H9759_13275 [Candidatus Dietzia intestinipullorum]|nr:hypothetical protein [Candidatus Dietzia intestinipullorum]
MRARLARPRKFTRGRLVAPVAAAAAVALVGGVVVAAPDTLTVDGDVRTASLAESSGEAGAEAGLVSFSFDLAAYVDSEFDEGAEIVNVADLPGGLNWDNAGTISGSIAPGEYSFNLTVAVDGQEGTSTVPFTVEQSAGSSTIGEGSLGGEAQAEGQVTTGSTGADAILGAVAEIAAAFGSDAGSVTDLATGSTGDVETGNETPDSPLGSLATGELDMGSLGGGETEGEIETGGELTTGSTGGGETTGGGEITVPGSSTTTETGSLGEVAPGLALSGAALLGLAGLSLVLSTGSSTSGSTAPLPSLPGSSGSSGSVAPTVAAGSPAPTTKAPGPEVANGRG